MHNSTVAEARHRTVAPNTKLLAKKEIKRYQMYVLIEQLCNSEWVVLDKEIN